MVSSASRAEAMKPLVLKAGIPLVVSVAGLIFARFITRRENRRVTSSASNSETTSPCEDRKEEEETGMTEDSETQGERDHKEDISILKTQIEELQKKEYELEMRFVHYCNLKDREYVLMELKSMLKLEKAYLEFFHTEVSTMEAENKKIQDLVAIYLKVLEEIQGLRSENGLLQGNVKRLTRRTKKLSNVIIEKNMTIGGVERELLRSLNELETKSKVATKMKEEIQGLKNVIDQLKEEKNELQSKSVGTKSEIVTAEDYRGFLREYQNLQRDRADEVKELIFLRWSNACLRHELMRSRGHDQEHTTQLEENAFGEDGNRRNSMDVLAFEQGDEHNGHKYNQDHNEGQNVCSKRKKLMKKLKRWVEGNDQKGKSKLDVECVERNCVTSEPEEEQIALAKKFCSSV